MGIPFLTANYFVGELFMPNLTGTTAAGLANIVDLQWYIDTYEKEFLKYLLGDVLYMEFAAEIAVSVPLVKWTALKNKIYVVSTGTNPTYLSPATAYVFFYYIRKHQSLTVSTGQIQTGYENGQTVENKYTSVGPWNKMVEDCKLLWEWLEEDAQRATYPNFSRQYEDYLGFINPLL
jgi:hypothetical protein